jgi:hypothetical protein
MKTKVTEIRYTYRKNLGNYEHEETTVAGIVEDSQEAVECLKELVSLAKTDLSKPVEVKNTEPKKEEKVEEQMEFVEQPQKKEEPEIKEETKPKKTKGSKATPKLTPYDRENDLHKKFFSEVLQKHYPEWKKNIPKAKEVSISLHGTDMLDAEGTVVKSFEDSVIEKMK